MGYFGLLYGLQGLLTYLLSPPDPKVLGRYAKGFEALEPEPAVQSSLSSFGCFPCLPWRSIRNSVLIQCRPCNLVQKLPETYTQTSPLCLNILAMNACYRCALLLKSCGPLSRIISKGGNARLKVLTMWGGLFYYKRSVIFGAIIGGPSYF